MHRGRFPAALLATGALVAVLAILRALESAGLHLPAPLSFCFLREVIGVACPLCGGTRSLLALAHGDPLGAVAVNPVVGLASVAILASPVLVMVPGIERMIVTARRLARPPILWPLFLLDWLYLTLRLAR